VGYLLRECQASDDLFRVLHDIAYMLVPGYGPVRRAASFTGPVAPLPQSSQYFAVFTLVFLDIRFGISDPDSPQTPTGRCVFAHSLPARSPPLVDGRIGDITGFL